MYQIMVEDVFSSAHQLIGYEGKCENLHGHTFKVQILLSGENLDDLGMLFDFKRAKLLLKDTLEEFDHKNLNTLPFFAKENPTAENIAKQIFFSLSDKISKEKIKLEKVIVWESEKSCAIFTL